MKTTPKAAAPYTVTCPYCKQVAHPLTGKLGETEPGRTRYGCENAHYFVYPERFGYEPVAPRRAAA